MLYKPIPIPTIKNNMIQIIRTNKTIIVDNFFEELLTITNKDLEKCTERDTHHVVCRFVDMAIEPIDKCIWNSFPLKKQQTPAVTTLCDYENLDHKNYVTKINPYTFFFFIATPETITIVYLNKTVCSIELNESMLLKFEETEKFFFQNKFLS